MSLQDEEANGHRRVGLLQEFVLAGEELFEGDEIVVRLTHLFAGDGNHVVVHPIVYHLLLLRGHGLCNFAFVVGEYQIHTSTMDVKFFAQVFAPHSGTLAVPTGETFAPR